MPDITIRELLRQAKKPLLSLEFFPPKDPLGLGVLGGSIERMRPVHPDFVTVTYGAGGSTRDFSMITCELLAKMGFAPVMAHVTCIGASRAELLALAGELSARGIRNIMALRGDPPRGQVSFQPAPDGLPHASDLVAVLKGAYPDFCLGVAGYPETHPEAGSIGDDIQHLKQKTDAGADFITTQLFFENDHYYRFIDRCRAAGIQQPVFPGLLPALSLKQVERLVALSRVGIPARLAEALKAAEADPAAAEWVGLEWTIRQIEDLIAHGVPGIHLYIMNRAKTVLAPQLKECLKHWR